MGLFDSVYFTCPKCGQKIEEQSKAGECYLMDYSCDAVPIGIATDMLSSTVICRGCKKRYTISSPTPFPYEVALTLIPESEDDS